MAEKGPRRQLSFPDSLNTVLNKANRYKSSLVTFAVKEFCEKYDLLSKNSDEIKAFIKLYGFISKSGSIEDISSFISNYPFIKEFKNEDEINAFIKMYPFLPVSKNESPAASITVEVPESTVIYEPEPIVTEEYSSEKEEKDISLSDDAKKSMQDILAMFNS